MKPNDLLKNILSDIKVDLAQKFDRNFEEKGFFGKKWTERRYENSRGSLLLVTGTMRRSIRAGVRGNGVVFTSSEPYTSLHNEGGKFAQAIRSHKRTNKKTGRSHVVKAHTRNINMVQRQFIGNHDKVEQSINNIMDNNVTEYFNKLAKKIRQ